MPFNQFDTTTAAELGLGEGPIRLTEARSDPNIEAGGFMVGRSRRQSIGIALILMSFGATDSVGFCGTVNHMEENIYENWSVQDAREYDGNYIGIYTSQEGKQISGKLALDVSKNLFKKGYTAKAKYIFRDLMSGEEIGRVTLRDVVIEGSHFHAKFPDLKEPLNPPNYKLDGKFVIRYPPANAKGQVHKGLLFGDEFYYGPD